MPAEAAWLKADDFRGPWLEIMAEGRLVDGWIGGRRVAIPESRCRASDWIMLPESEPSAKLVSDMVAKLLAIVWERYHQRFTPTEYSIVGASARHCAHYSCVMISDGLFCVDGGLVGWMRIRDGGGEYEEQRLLERLRPYCAVIAGAEVSS